MLRCLRIIYIPLEKGKLPVAVLPYLRDYPNKNNKEESSLSPMEKIQYLIDYKRVSRDNDDHFDEVDRSILNAIREKNPLAFGDIFPATDETDISNCIKKYENWYPFSIDIALYEDLSKNPGPSTEGKINEIKLTLFTPEDISVFTKEPLSESPLFKTNHPQLAEYEERFMRYTPLLNQVYSLEISSIEEILKLLSSSPLTPCPIH